MSWANQFDEITRLIQRAEAREDSEAVARLLLLRQKIGDTSLMQSGTDNLLRYRELDEGLSRYRMATPKGRRRLLKSPGARLVSGGKGFSK